LLLRSAVNASPAPTAAPATTTPTAVHSHQRLVRVDLHCDAVDHDRGSRRFEIQMHLADVASGADQDRLGLLA
jgi:hypothetical protein